MLKKILIALMASFFIASSNAFAGVADNLTFNGYISDSADVLSADTEKNLNLMMHDLYKKTNSMLALVTVKSLNGENIDSVNEKILDTYKIGDPKTNKSVLFFISIDEKQLQVVLGEGLVGKVKPEDLKSIIDGNVIPFFKMSKYEDGIVKGTYLLSDKVAKIDGQTVAYSGELPKNELKLGNISKAWLWLLLVPFLAVVGLIVKLAVNKNDKHEESAE